MSSIWSQPMPVWFWCINNSVGFLLFLRWVCHLAKAEAGHVIDLALGSLHFLLSLQRNILSFLSTGWCCCPGLWDPSITSPMYHMLWGFTGSSAGKESACDAGDSGSIPGSGRSPGDGIGYPLQYSWTSLVAQLVKNPPAMWETWVWSLSWENPGKVNGYPLQYSGLENSMDCIVYGVPKSWTQLNNSYFTLHTRNNKTE